MPLALGTTSDLPTTALHTTGFSSRVTRDQVMLIAFPFTLKGKAKQRMKRLLAESITAWELLRKAFLNEYHPPLKIIKQIRTFRSFKQEPNEPLHCLWERFTESLFSCPEHKLNEHEQLRIFYQGLDTETRRKVDFKGLIPRMTPTKGMEAINELSTHSLSWYKEGSEKSENKEFQIGGRKSPKLYRNKSEGVGTRHNNQERIKLQTLKNPLENITNPQDKPETKETATKNFEDAPDDHRKSVESCNHIVPFPGRLKKEKEK
ncbi:integrase, catalytic region, zinc finger, CCHC-type containing protein [Tanacetum coccineum]